MSIPDPWPAPRANVPVQATVSLPGSKSLTNRALVLAAIADGPSVIRRALRSRDTLLMASALTSLGSDVDTSGDDWRVTPGPFVSGTEVDCGLAGTVMRFVPPIAAMSKGDVAFVGDAHMRNRPIGEVLSALRDLGVRVDGEALPFTLRGAGGVRGGTVTIDASASSQFVSALLLAGARYEQGIELRHVGDPVPSLHHIEMTIAMLREHQVEVDDSEPDRWSVAPGAVKAADHAIEPDLSIAAPFLGLAAVSGGTVTVRDWPEHTHQPGVELRDILTRMGCTVTFDGDLTVTGPPHGTLQGVEMDLRDVAELTPAVAALCAVATTPSHLTGVGHIRGHETDRLAALATELGALGADITELDDGLTIRPAPLHGGVFHTYADHRMAHAGVIVGAAVDDVRVENIATTSKTFTDFAPFWAELF